ncbi:MAG: TspO/MBR family protein [Alphaproteobacteria bacterium]
MSEIDWLALGIFIVVNFAAASSGAIFKPGAWYEALKKPSWTPPNWAFPVVWTTLFAANAWSGYLVWQAAGPDAALALTAYGISLVFNAIWSFLFFGLRRLDLGMAEVVALWASIAVVLVLFVPYSQTAALLQVPYLAWVTLAGVLNLRLLQLNGPRGEQA